MVRVMVRVSAWYNTTAHLSDRVRSLANQSFDGIAPIGSPSTEIWECHQPCPLPCQTNTPLMTSHPYKGMSPTSSAPLPNKHSFDDITPVSRESCQPWVQFLSTIQPSSFRCCALNRCRGYRWWESTLVRDASAYCTIQCTGTVVYGNSNLNPHPNPNLRAIKQHASWGEFTFLPCA
jgi:hypothetical protein